MDFYDELLGIVDLLEEKRIEYAVCGGVAVAVHGYPRFTKDIDLLVQKQDLESVVNALALRGFLDDAGEIVFDRGTPNERVVIRISKCLGSEILTLDLLLVTAVFADVWRDRDVALWSGRALKIVSRRGLRKMKSLAGRDQDMLDLKKLGLADEANK